VTLPSFTTRHQRRYSSSDEEEDNTDRDLSAWSHDRNGVKGNNNNNNNTRGGGGGGGGMSASRLAERRIAFITDLLTPAQLGGNTFDGAMECTNILPNINKVETKRFRQGSLTLVFTLRLFRLHLNHFLLWDELSGVSVTIGDRKRLSLS